MNYGMQISASGLFTSMYRMDVLSNNLANVQTRGFKGEVTATMLRAAARIEDRIPGIPADRLLERLGGGALVAPNRISMEQGPIEATHNPLDLAIEGDGFFAVRDQTDVSGDRVRFTRDGRFALDRSGTLVTATDGRPVLDAQGRTISLRDGGDVTVDADGTIRQDRSVVARLQFVGFERTDGLIRRGQGAFGATASAIASRRPATGAVRQGQVENSSVDPVSAMVDLGAASREVEANASLVQAQDRMNDRAISGLGRVI